MDMGNEICGELVGQPGMVEDDECDDSMSSSDEEDLQEESELAAFMAKLTQAQQVAEEVEHACCTQTKRPRHYNSNVLRTKQRHEQKRRELERKGYLSIQDFLAHSQKVKIVHPPQNEAAKSSAMVLPTPEVSDGEVEVVDKPVGYAEAAEVVAEVFEAYKRLCPRSN